MEQAEDDPREDPHPLLVHRSATADDRETAGQEFLGEADEERPDRQPEGVFADAVDLAPLRGSPTMW